MAGVARRPAPSRPAQPAATPRRLRAPGFDPLPSTRAMRAGDADSLDDHPSLRPLHARASRRPTPRQRLHASTGAEHRHARLAHVRLDRRADALARVFANPEQRLAALARVLADPEPAIRRAMRILAARWEDHTLRLPQPEPDPEDDMPGEPAHIAHPRPRLAAALDRPDFEIVSVHEFDAHGRLVEIPIERCDDS